MWTQVVISTKLWHFTEYCECTCNGSLCTRSCLECIFPSDMCGWRRPSTKHLHLLRNLCTYVRVNFFVLFVVVLTPRFDKNHHHHRYNVTIGVPYVGSPYLTIPIYWFLQQSSGAFYELSYTRTYRVAIQPWHADVQILQSSNHHLDHVRRLQTQLNSNKLSISAQLEC